MKITIQEIATHLNLSSATVSRVLNGRQDGFISDATRQRVLAAAREMGYQPNRAARALVTGRTNLIAYWVSHLHEPYYASIIYPVQSQVKKTGYELIVSEMGSSGDWNAGQSQANRWPVDGIIACDFLGSDQAYRDAVGTTPNVSMGAYYLESAHFVGVDLNDGAREAMLHLLGSGCRRVAYLVPEVGSSTGDARYDAYTGAVEEAGQRPEYIVTRDYSRRSAREALGQYVDAHGCPDGIFCRNDDMAIGAYRALRDRGVSIPGDVALVGCDGIEDTEYLDTPLTTIRQPVEEMCATAWDFLQRCMDDPGIPLQQCLLKPSLVVRESSRR